MSQNKGHIPTDLIFLVSNPRPSFKGTIGI